MIAHWIWLTGLPGLGPVRQRELLELFGSAEALYEAKEAELRRAGLTDEAVRLLLQRDLSQAEETARRCAEAGLTAITLRDEAYPAPLRAVPDAPSVLYLRGKLPPLGQKPAVGLVGSRDADEAGLSVARRLGWQVAGCGGIVVTGMAMGVDACAARGAVDYGGEVIGVLGCGADVVYPKREAELFELVLRNGCLLSEYPPGTAPNARHFPARNRIISALSDGVVVIQAAERSGSLITARWAADQGRDVFAVPGPAGARLSRGCNQLLRDGAILAECGWDIVSEYEYRYPGAVREYHGRPFRPASASQQAQAEPPAMKNAAPVERQPAPEPSAPVRRPIPEGLSELQRAILQALQDGPMQLDALIDALGRPAAAVLPELTVLQIRKLIACLPGKRYTIRDP